MERDTWSVLDILSITSLSLDNALLQGVLKIANFLNLLKWKDEKIFSLYYFGNDFIFVFKNTQYIRRNSPADATQLPIVAVDTMHIKCNNGASFYPWIRCQILLRKMSFNQSFIDLHFVGTVRKEPLSIVEFSLAEKVMINKIRMM